MRTKRRLLTCILVAAIFPLGLGLALAVPRRLSQDRRLRLERVAPGMSREQVLDAVGCPPGRYDSNDILDRGVVFLLDYSREDQWSFDEALLQVCYDENGAVVAVNLNDVHDYRPTFQDRTHNFLGL